MPAAERGIKGMPAWRLRNLFRILFCVALLLGVFWGLFPSVQFDVPYSTVIYDNEGELAGALVAADGQWRMHTSSSVPEKLERAIIQFEDAYFYYHPGFNPVSMLRALWQNIRQGRVVSGGSTISMQVLRLSRKNKARKIGEKIQEVMGALRLELTYSKKEILQMYTLHAPYGANIVGLEAASWRYFGRSPEALSWGEAALLAVLPNAPSLIFPGKNQLSLLKKRNRLLARLYRQQYMDKLTFELACAEPLPEGLIKLPKHAQHLLQLLHKQHPGMGVQTTLNSALQQQVSSITDAYARQYARNGIHNAAVLVLDVPTGNVLAYVGNAPSAGKEHEGDVDVIQAPRSPGSVLKPLLFASMLDAGELLPNMLLPDIPTQIVGYSPKNFDLGYDGAIPAKRALARSLNVPAVIMLKNFGIEKFHYILTKKIRFASLRFPASHYGLSIILGGGENSLWDLAGCYASMARTLNNFTRQNGLYNVGDFRFPQYREKIHPEKWIEPFPVFSAAAIYQTFQALVEVNRPDLESAWLRYASTRPVAWKTGTSFGFRDAWAIGTTPEYVVAVWVGNADGEGRKGLTGIATAAPILFDVFSALPQTSWFQPPYDELEKIPACRQSGYRLSPHCTDADTTYVLQKGLQTKACPYHQPVHLDATGTYRVTTHCETPQQIQHFSWFTLPPVMEYYFRKKNPWYKTLPPWRADCFSGEQRNPMAFVYPTSKQSRILLPRGLQGKPEKLVLEAAHRNPQAQIFWHLNDTYLGETQHIHQQAVFLEKGKHTITLVDEEGNTVHTTIIVE